MLYTHHGWCSRQISCEVLWLVEFVLILCFSMTHVALLLLFYKVISKLCFKHLCFSVLLSFTLSSPFLLQTVPCATLASISCPHSHLEVAPPPDFRPLCPPPEDAGTVSWAQEVPGLLPRPALYSSSHLALPLCRQLPR